MVYRILRNVDAVLLVALLTPPVLVAGVLVAVTLVVFAVADVLSGAMEGVKRSPRASSGWEGDGDGEVGMPRWRSEVGCRCGLGCRHETSEGATFCWLVGGPARYGVGEREGAKHG
jgi:hypothetical protein